MEVTKYGINTAPVHLASLIEFSSDLPLYQAHYSIFHT